MVREKEMDNTIHAHHLLQYKDNYNNCSSYNNHYNEMKFEIHISHACLAHSIGMPTMS